MIPRLGSVALGLAFWACTPASPESGDGGGEAGSPALGVGGTRNDGSGGDTALAGGGGDGSAGSESGGAGLGGGSNQGGGAGGGEAASGGAISNAGGSTGGGAGEPIGGAGAGIGGFANSGGAASGGTSGGGQFSSGGSGGGESELVHDCITFLDRTAEDASRIIPWGFGISSAPERCLRIRLGQSVRFEGSFSTHPMGPSGGDVPSPIVGDYPTGAEEYTVEFLSAGTFGYECLTHTTMRGAIQVVP